MCMETKKAIVDGKELDVVVSLDDVFKNDYAYYDDKFDKTSELKKIDFDSDEKTTVIERVIVDEQGKQD